MDPRPAAPAPRRRLRGAPILLAGGLALGLGAAGAAATPTISPDTDVWTIANPGPSYTIGSTLVDPTTVSWTIGGLVGDGAVPLTIKPALADGTYTLDVKDIGDGLTAQRTFTVDMTAPKITVSQPTSGAVFDVGASVLAGFVCEGAATCTGPVAPGGAIDTSKAGSFTFTVKAADDVGNQAVSLVDYVVKEPGTTPPVATGGPSEPISLVPTPPTPGTRKSPYRPRTLNAKALRPRAGLKIPTRTPLLRWGARKGATLYNVQIYWLHGTAATKVVSMFPRSHHLRVPPGRVAYGHTYVWRVWPYLRGHYASRPLGLSFFSVRKAPVRRR